MPSTPATSKARPEHRATITEGKATVIVQSAKVNFKTGDTQLGRIEGTL